MRITILRIFTTFAVVAFLAIALFGVGGTALAKGADIPAQQTGFRWQMAVELRPDTSSAPAEAISALGKNGVKATVTDKQLVMDGQGNLDQVRAALFDTASPWMDFLGGPVELTLHLPANAAALTLKLEARITAGYRWAIVAEPGALYAQSAQPTFSMRYQGYGAPAIQTVQLKGTGQGDTTLRLIYQRPFGPTERVYARLNIWMPAAADIELSDPTPVEPARDASVSQPGMDEPDPLAELLPKALPASWDWRTKGIVTPIRDQGGCGSCWAFATVGAMEAALKKSGGPTADLSEQFLVSCNTEGWSCNGGWDSHEYHYNTLGKNQTQIGAVLESAKPYTGANGSCTVALSHPYKLTGWGYVGGLNSGNYWYSIPTYEQLKTAIYTHGPITTGVCAGSAFSYYSGGLFQTDEAAVCGSSPNHLIVLVGWNDADHSLILRNSWNTWWGEGGYMRIKYGTSMVGVAPTWVTRASSQPVPTIIAPSGNITTTKPTYTWSKVGATASYKLQVYDIAAATYRINTTVSSSYCNSATNRCSYTPNVVLTKNKNYQWRASAGSGAWSGWKTFKPLDAVPGFDSQFTGTGIGWSPVYGNWSVASSTYYLTTGAASYFSSAKHTNSYSNFTYEARVKRTGCDWCSNYLIIRGAPAPLNALKAWYKDIRFQYQSNGVYSVWRDNAGGYATIKNYTYTSAIAQNNWNTLKVIASGGIMKFYINGSLVWSGNVAVDAAGQVGIGMYRDTSTTGNQLLVDWAKLTPTVGVSDPLEQYPPTEELFGFGDGGGANP